MDRLFDSKCLIDSKAENECDIKTEYSADQNETPKMLHRMGTRRCNVNAPV